MACTAKKIVDLAKSEIGYTEKATNANLNSKTANAGHNNWNKYAAYIDKNFPQFYNTPKNGFDWCDIFVDYLFLKCYGYQNALRLLCQPEKSAGAGCPWSFDYYKAAGRARAYPAIGAQIFFDYGSGIAHTGIVIAYDNSWVYTVEGNSSDAVNERKYKRTDPRIAGYGHPDYDEGEEAVAKKTVEEIAYEVIRGDWGVGAERETKLIAAGYDYKAVQKKVNEILTASSDPQKKTKYILRIDTSKHDVIEIRLV